LKDYQPILFPYAYNILGSAEDARDAIQDVLYNYLSVNKEGIENEKNYLIRSVINQSINIRNKRKKLALGDMWLPEPVATERADAHIDLSEIVSYSMLVLLEQLSSRERAVFILKESFGYSHEEIAGILSTTIENSRKLLSRAKLRLSKSKQPVKLLNPQTAHAGFLQKYLQAYRTRDVKVLEKLLSEDIAFFADGGKMNVVAKIRTGRQAVRDLLDYLASQYDAYLEYAPAVINHQPALLHYREGQLVVCQIFGISEDGKIFQINNVIDPEKLKRLQAG
jgi:RNA polymerase sigma factor (sigma-70 family)